MLLRVYLLIKALIKSLNYIFSKTPNHNVPIPKTISYKDFKPPLNFNPP